MFNTKRLHPSPQQVRIWVQKHFPDFKESKGGEELRINNPLVSDDDFHLWINVRKACVNDFRPQAKNVTRGSFLWFVKQYKNISFWEAVKEVMGNDISYTPIIQEEQHETVSKIELPEHFKELTQDDDSTAAVAVKTYLKRRMISEYQITVNHIGYNMFNAVFPYIENDEIVYWQSRSVINRWFQFPDNTNKTDYVYGLDNIEPEEPIIITESIFNALMFDRAVAIGGSSISDKQINKIKQYKPSQIIIAFDNDVAGRKGTCECYDKFGSEYKLYYSFPPGDDDWNDLAIKCGIDGCRNYFYSNICSLDFSTSIKLKVASVVG